MKSLFRSLRYRFRPIPDPSTGIITGEKIQLLCDHYIGMPSDLIYNPIIKKKKKQWLTIKNLNAPFNNKPVVFCYGNLLKKMDLLVQKLRWLQHSYVLVFHNSDQNFNDEHLGLFDQLPKLQKIFTQNMNVEDERVTPLPIGIANSMWPHGNVSHLKSMLNREIKKTELIYFHFNIQTNTQKRSECFQNISNKGINFLPKSSFEEYLSILGSHKYSICPEGNGIDTHRFWECLYLKVVPICKRTRLTEFYSKDFPVLLLNDWEDLDTNQLEERYQNIDWSNRHKLDMKYYKELLEIPDKLPLTPFQ